MSVKKYLRQNENLIRNTLQYFDPNATFSVSGLTRERNNLIKKIKKSDRIKSTLLSNLHKNYRSVNLQVGSIADPLEQFRARVAFINIVRYASKCLNHDVNDIFWTTIFMPQHEVDLGRLSTITPKRVKNKVERAINKLIREEYPNAVAAGFVEVQVTEINGYYYFSPHTHFITWGIPRRVIKGSIKVRRLKDTPPKKKLELTKKLPTFEDTIRAGKYSTKFKAELNQTNITDEAVEYGRTDRPMPDKYYAEWVEWMLQYDAHDLLILKGFDRSIGKKFRKATIQDIVDEFLANNKSHPQLY